MTQSLDEKIFTSFIQVIKDKRLLSDKHIEELQKIAARNKITADDWELLIEKECFPVNKVETDGSK